MLAPTSNPPAPRRATNAEAPPAAHRGNRIVLEGAPAVRALRASLRYSRPKALVQIAGTSLTEDERWRWEERLSRYYPACGCSLGTTLMSLTALIGAMGVIRQWWITGAFAIAAVAFAVAATLLAAICGKIIGLFLGHVRLSYTLRRLAVRLERS